MTTDGPDSNRRTSSLLAWFNIFIGLAGGLAGLWLALFVAALSAFASDGLPALGLAAACGLLGIAGVLMLLSVPVAAKVAITLAAVAALGGVTAGCWRFAERGWGDSAVLGTLTAPVVVIAVAEIFYLRRHEPKT